LEELDVADAEKDSPVDKSSYCITYCEDAEGITRSIKIDVVSGNLRISMCYTSKAEATSCGVASLTLSEIFIHSWALSESTIVYPLLSLPRPGWTRELGAKSATFVKAVCVFCVCAFLAIGFFAEVDSIIPPSII
jgi:hypothetical protein